MKMKNLTKIRESIFKGKIDDAVKYTKGELDRGTPISEILKGVLINYQLN